MTTTCPAWCTREHARADTRHTSRLTTTGDTGDAGVRLTGRDGEETTIRLSIWAPGDSGPAEVALTPAQAHRIAAQLQAAAQEASQ